MHANILCVSLSDHKIFHQKVGQREKIKSLSEGKTKNDVTSVKGFSERLDAESYLTVSTFYFEIWFDAQIMCIDA